MARPAPNPFYAVLGLVGILFVLTASSYCLSVLRGVRPAARPTARPHPLESLMDRHGTALLTGELIVLAISTVGAVAVDHVRGEKLRRQRRDERRGLAQAADAVAHKDARP
jgi:hypothetical protein